ncbi:hypothetical protein FEM03_07340 [Phragmitibacter flavus]|uniref:TIGR02646 family protein n=1 Tax=Phragmitibacter flavus TaxID=2576071 RepID=A0A5R8KG97_9BACT|nr:hypothetical protein [Phragmitibacter flavus]TLD71337.1 hypothetical protein FEM03_07340 [Phragmitibacter flavus]
MVRYSVTANALEQAINDLEPTWLTRAAQRTATFKNLGRYEEASGIWSEIKAVYMKLQGNKCAFCERELENSKIEHDVEHYRPKGNAKAWPTPKILEKKQFPFSLPSGQERPGYHLLAYHTWNYLTSCKTCNSNLKSDFFPIAGSSIAGEDHPKNYRDEDAYLLYPLGTLDQNPEKVFTFEGIFPMPCHKQGKTRLRALVTIAFFELDIREHLLKQRARILIDFSRAYADWKTASTQRKRDRGQADIERMTKITAPHASCVRSFRRLCESDPDEADRILEAVWDYLESLNVES